MNMVSSTSKKLGILFLSIFYLVCVSACGGSQTSSTNKQVTASKADLGPQVQQKSNAMVNFTEVNIDNMVKELNDNALAAAERYKGKRLKITGGHLDVIDSDGKYISLAGRNTFLKDVQAYLTSPQQRNQIKVLKRKQPLILYVEITDVGEVLGYSADIIKIEVPGSTNEIPMPSKSIPVESSNQKPASNYTDSNSTVPTISPNAVASAVHSSADKEGSYVHSALLTIDNNTKSCWTEGVPGLGIGEFIVINFNGKYKVNGMYIWAGHQKTESLYFENARPTAIRVIGTDGSNEVYYLRDICDGQSITFKRPINVSSVKIIIEKVTSGTKYEDTCIAEIKFF